MFKFLKEKLKKAVSIFSKKVEQEAEIKKEVKEEIREVPAPPPKPAPRFEAEPEPEFEKEEKPEEPGEAPREEPEEKEEALEIEIDEEAKEIKEELKQELEEIQEEEETKKHKFTLEELEVEEILPEESPEKEIRRIKEKLLEEKTEEKGGEPKEEEKKGFFAKIFGKKDKKEEKPAIEKEIPDQQVVKKEIIEEVEEPERIKEKEIKEEHEIKRVEEKKEEEKEKKLAKAKIKKEEKAEAEVEEKRGFFQRIKETFTTVKLSDEKFEELFWELEVPLMENNVAVEVIEKIKADLKKDLTTGKVSRKGVDELIEDSLRESVQSLFIDKHLNLVNEIKKKKDKPYIIVFIGVNGSGKTTTMAKMAYNLMKHNLSVVFAASDTFRAAAIQQLQEHADRLGVKMIKHDYESDPAAVAFDAVKHAKAKGIDVVMIDTAGRLHVNDNLMNELKKLVRVNKPDMKIFVGESITGNDCIEQAKIFNEAVGIDAIILAKADVDEKGGAAVSVSYVTKKPIIYLGTGQKYEDLQEFKPEVIIKNIGL